ESFGGKPIFISEIGACGLYGIHDDDYAQWSEEFQTDFMRTAAEVICEDGRFCGYTLWQFCDTRSYQRGYIRTKPRGFNCAGIVDEYRRKKLVYKALADFIKSRKKD
ncbi:MAG: beta-galactosidase, partial [Lentisphaeria bacterium]|nr:beta-galactosidase [Lentisphaeria bacterium]